MSDLAPVLRATHLRRVLGKKEFLAVADVTFDIVPGEILCILGPNGAGKTTTVKMCATLLSPTAGQIEIGGIDAIKHPAAAREQLGLVLGGDKGFYLRATARDNLLFFADVAKVARKERKERVEAALDAVALTERAGDKVQTFSRGMRQRLHIARALLANPQLLLLDEPSNGLDPEIALGLRTLIRDLADQGVAILLTTHYLAEAEALADRLLVLQKGMVQSDGVAGDIAAAAGLARVSTFSVADSREQVDNILRGLWPEGWFSTTSLHSRTYVQLMWPHDRSLEIELSALQQAFTETPKDLATRKPTLEESYLAFLESTRVEAPNL